MKIAITGVALLLIFISGFFSGRVSMKEEVELILAKKVEIKTVDFGNETIKVFMEISNQAIEVAEKCYESKNTVMPRPITIKEGL